MNIAIGIVLLLVAIVFGINAINSASGRYGSHNRGRNILLAGSIATLGVIGAIYAFGS